MLQNDKQRKSRRNAMLPAVMLHIDQEVKKKEQPSTHTHDEILQLAEKGVSQPEGEGRRASKGRKRRIYQNY